MATSLASQLKRLATPQTTILDQKRSCRSILFEPSEAAKYGRDVFYDIGRSGFQVLVTTDPSFKQFDESLFGRVTKELQRAVEDRDTNERLSGEIDHFLLLLSPYLEKEAALRALEWLVYRFMAHEMNQRALLMAIFPYYESALFTRVLQVLQVWEDTGEWHWLRGAQKTGRPLPKQTVFTRWAHNQAFRGFLSEYLRRMLKVHSGKGTATAVISFYISTVLGGMCILQEVKEEHVSSVVKMVPQCLSTGWEPLVAGCYLILAHLSIKAHLTPSLVNTLLQQILQTHPPPEKLREQCVLCLLALAHHQGLKEMAPSLALALDSSPLLLVCVDSLARDKSVAALLCPYVLGYVRYLIEECPMKEGRKASRFLLLVKKLSSIPLSSSDASRVIWSLFESVKTHHESLTNLPGFTLGEAMQKLEASHPEGHSQAIAHMASLQSDSKTGKIYKKMMKSLVATLPGGTTSFTQLVHPEDSVRVVAVGNYLSRLDRGMEKDKDVIRMHLKNMLVDECPDIILQALSSTRGLETLETPYLVDQCQKLLSWATEKGKNWAKVKQVTLKVLTNTLVDRYNDQTSLSVLFVCLPYVLFPQSSGDFAASRLIMESKLAKKTPFLLALQRETASYIADKSKARAHEYSARMWKVLPRVIGGLTRDEHLAFWTYVETQLNLEHAICPHFMTMVLLYCSLKGKKMDSSLSLKAAHRLLDACLISLSFFKVSVCQKEEFSKKDQKEHITQEDISKYLREVKGGALPLAFVTQSILCALQTFSLPEPFKSSPYWTPFMESEAREGSLVLLVKVLKAAQQLEKFGEIGSSTRDTLLVAVLKDCLQTPKRRFYFLAFIWGWHSSLPFTDLIDEALQAWTLTLGSALLASQSPSLAWTLGTTEPLVPALVSALTSGQEGVRRGAVGCVRRLGEVRGGSLTHDSHTPLLQAILTQVDELMADESQLSSLLGKTEANQGPGTQQTAVTHCLLAVVTSDGPPQHLKAALLYALTSARDSSVLLNLLPMGEAILQEAIDLQHPEKSQLDVASSLCLYYILLRFTAESAEILETEAGWSLFLKALQCPKAVLNLHSQTVSPQAILLDQVLSSKFLSTLKNEVTQSKLWSVLVTRVVESGDPHEASRLRHALRRVTLDAQVIAKQIEELNLTTKATSIRAARAKRIKMKVQDSPQIQAWQKLELMLETIGVMGSLGRPWLLVAPISQCLQQTLSLDLPCTPLIQQQILSAVLRLLQKATEELGEEEVSKKVQVNVELIVQCIRSSLSHDTHRRALLILAFAAKITPDAVMHNMMAIFTFMGTSLLHRDDSYSFQVIHQTIESIVPTLVKCEAGEKVEVRLAQVCQVFVDALPDLPHHRRLPLFTQLATTLQPDLHLWLLMAHLADSHVMRGSSWGGEEKGDDGEERRTLPQIIQFALTLAAQFSVATQVQACCRLVDFVRNLAEEKEHYKALQKSQGKMGKRKEGDIIPLEAHSPRQVFHFKYTTTGLVAHLLASEKFVGKVYEAREGHESELLPLYKQLLEVTMCYLQAVTSSCNLQKDKPAGRQFTSLQRKVVEVVEGVTAVQPSGTFLKVTCGLLASPVAMVRCRATELMCAKLQPNTAFFREEDVHSLQEVTKILLPAALNQKEPTENRQTSLYSLQLLTKFLAPYTSAGILEPILVAAVTLICRGEEEDARVETQGLLVAAEAVSALQVEAVCQLPQLVPALNQVLARPNLQDTQLLAALTTLHKVSESLPQMLSPFLEEVLCRVCQVRPPGEEMGVAGGNRESRVSARLGAVRDTLVAKVEARILIPKLVKAYSTLVKQDMESLHTLMSMVECLVGQADTRTLTTHKPALTTLFTRALDLRADRKGDMNAVDRLESGVFTAVGKLLLRLNEHDNISFFLSLQNWAAEDEKKPGRLITFYRFSDYLAGTYKVLFIVAKLAESIMVPTAALLNRLNASAATQFGSGAESEAQTCVLLRAVLNTLTKVFLYDQVGFTTQERFQLLVTPLTDLLDNQVGGVGEYQGRVSHHLVPCLTQLTVAVADDSLWKTLNRQVLLRLRNHDSPHVILGALETFQVLVETLGEDYLQPLLADSMPAITEALEITHPEVEATTREIFTKMEAILGDSLRAYLDY